jgi:hypothetical protein
MASFVTSPRRQAASAPGSEGPSVLHARRPPTLRVDASPISTTRLDLAAPDDAVLPRTMLRLPDLTRAVRGLRQFKVNYLEIAQWVALALGALLALWLIFGNRRAATPAPEAPPLWTAPATTPGKEPAGKDTPASAEAPQWAPPAAPYESEPTPPELPAEWAGTSGGAGAAPAYTAQRPEPPGNPAAVPRAPSDPQPLGITVPVQP